MSKKQKTLTQGFRKGGHNDAPTTARPKVRPQAESSLKSPFCEACENNENKNICKDCFDYDAWEQKCTGTQVKIFVTLGALLPTYKSKYASGMDLHAYKSDVLQSGERRLIPTGVYIEIPNGYEGQIRPRSGLAYKYGITVLNSPGTIDSDYRGEIKVLLINHGKESFMIHEGDRIAQLVIVKVEQAKLSLVDHIEELTDTSRGSGGFGSTGK